MRWQDERVMITGGNGFLGKAIATALLSKGAVSVAVFCRSECPQLEKAGVEVVNGDIRDADALRRACENRTMLFHCAAKAEIWGDRREFFSVNVEGTKNAVESAYRNGIGVLVNTSSPSVVIPPGGVSGADESIPYPGRYLASYPESKAHAERIVSSAATERLRSISIRPHLIWGPGDPHILPRLIKKAEKGELTRIGDGKNLVDLSYVENAAHAHVLAAEKLRISDEFSGRNYFVSDGKRVNLWTWIDDFLIALGMEPVHRKVSARTGYAMAWLCEIRNRLFDPDGEPRITRFAAMQMAHDHYFDISAIRRDLGYEPVVSPEKAMRDTVEWFRIKRGGGKISSTIAG